MKLLLFTSLMFLAATYSLSLEADEDTANFLEFVGAMKSLQLEDSIRADSCTPQYHDCTSDRHSCCRGPNFKYVCDCFYAEAGGDMCTCQEPKSHKAGNKIISGAKSLFGKIKGKLG